MPFRLRAVCLGDLQNPLYHVLSIFLPHAYLQVRYTFLKGLQVVSQGSLLLQELGVPALTGRLEEAVVVNVPQRLGEGADDLLLGAPHRAVQVQLEAPLTDTEQVEPGSGGTVGDKALFSSSYSLFHYY